MSTHIRLGDATGLTAGIEFVDGSAIVGDLSPSARKYFEYVGAEITDGVTVIEGVVLEDLDAKDLRAIAKSAGVTVARGATKDDLIASINAADLPILTNNPED